MTLRDLPGSRHVATDPIGVAAAVATWLVERSRERERFSIALAGGTTPRFLYEALASSSFRDRVDWQRWHVYFSDERAVPPDDPSSNYRLAHDTFLAKVDVPADQVHRMEAERPDLDAAAADYSALLAAARGEPPRLDVILLGLGGDGHTASLFPGTPALDVTDTWATRGRADYEPFDRVTMTLPTLNAAAHVAFLVTGPAKGEALRAVAAGTVPAGRVRPHGGELLWFLDGAAAGSAG